MNLHQYDLNLLVIFNMIHQELHLTKAGEKLNMSQPAMSQALKKLREVFQDPLFVRNGKTMIATEKARQLAPQVSQIVSLTLKTFQDKGSFDPATSNRSFALSMSDYTEMVMMPRLFKRIQEVAPHVKIESSHLSSKDYQQSLDSGDVDIILSCSLHFKANSFQQFLFDDYEVVIVRSDSRILKDPLTLERYVEFKHAQFKWMAGDNEIDQKLRALQLQRSVVLEVQHEMVLPLVLQNIDILVNLPKRMAIEFNKLVPLEILEIPLPKIEYHFSQHWHERNNQDPAHAWLRKEIYSVANSL